MDEKNDKSGIKEQVDRRIAKELLSTDDKNTVKHVESGKINSVEEISSQMIIRAVLGGEKHDANIYTNLCREVIKYDPIESIWYHFNGNNWLADGDDGVAFANIDRLIDCYKLAYDNYRALPMEQRNPEIEKRFIKRLFGLANKPRRMNILKFIRSGQNSFAEKCEFDTNPYLLGVANGVVDLRTGDLRESKAADNVKTICPHKYLGIDEVPKEWEKFLLEILNGDELIYAFFQRVFGYAISGLSTHHQFIVLTGRGRNGKGTLFETLLYVLGDYMKPVPSELLVKAGRAKRAADAAPEILMLRGVRVAVASETDEHDQFSASRVKWLSGGDTLTGRPLWSRDMVQFVPTHTLFLITNNKPKAPPDDYAFWERIYSYNLELSFVDHPPTKSYERFMNPDLPSILRSEASAILSWLVRGFLQWQEVGFNAPQKVREAIDSWRREEDILQDFLDDCCYDSPDSKIQAKDIYEAFKNWAEDQGWSKIWSQKAFSTRLHKKYDKVVSNKIYYIGVGLKNESSYK